MKKTQHILLYLTTIFFCSCNMFQNNEIKTDTVVEYTRKINLPESSIYFIKNEFQEEALNFGQPYIDIYDKQFRKIKIGTCYEEMPFLIDTFLSQKKQVLDTMSFYALNEIPIEKKLLQLKPYKENIISIDSSKKYFVFYHFALYAEKLDKVKVPPMFERYKDSIQFFFINVDKIKD